MSKRLILILALAFVVGLCLTAYAEVQNVKVSGDLTVQGVARNNIMLQKTNNAPRLAPNQFDYNQFDHRIAAILSHIRVRIDADLTDNVSTAVRLINERVWGEEGDGASSDTVNSTDIDLDLAYVTLKEFLYSPLSLTVGRQELMFGSGLIVGDVDTNGIMAGHGNPTTAAATRTAVGTILPRSLDDLSLRKAFDAVRATLNYDPLVVDLVFAKVDENAVDAKDDVNLMGLNANYALDAATTLEGYFWQKEIKKLKPATVGVGGGQAREASDDDVTRTLGARAQYTGITNLTLGLEGAWQSGKYLATTTVYPDDAMNDMGSRKRKAYALQLTSQYSLLDLMPVGKRFEPVIGVNYTLLSGNPYRSNEKYYRGWDPMYENQAGGTLFNKILGFSNCQLLNVNASMVPMQDLKVGLGYYNLRFMKPYRSADIGPLGVTLSGVVGDPTYTMVPKKKDIGNELDASLTYDYTEDVQLGLSMGWFFPGNAFDKVNDETASQVIGSMKVTF